MLLNLGLCSLHRPAAAAAAAAHKLDREGGLGGIEEEEYGKYEYEKGSINELSLCPAVRSMTLYMVALLI